KDVAIGVGLPAVFLDIQAIGPSVQLPVDLAYVVAGIVAAVLGEIGAVAQVRRAVQPMHETLDDRARQQLDVGNPRQRLRVDETRRLAALRVCDRTHSICPDLKFQILNFRSCPYNPDFGLGTTLTSLLTTSSVVTFSDSA